MKVVNRMNGLVYLFMTLILCVSYNCSAENERGEEFSRYTKETENLLNYLHSLKETSHILFGHHLTNVERQSGQNWNKAWDETNSDVYEASGSMPAVFSFDFGRGINMATEHCKAIYSWGGIITFSWHAKNPITGGGFKDLKGNPMGKLSIEGSDANKVWTAQLDEIANELNGLKYKGVKIPIIFRPFHEHTGSWFGGGKEIVQLKNM